MNASRPSVVVIGASADRTKFGNKSVRAHLQQGYDVYPVNPKGGEIEGLQAYRTLGELPVKHVDRVTMYVLPHLGKTMLSDIAALTPNEVWLNPGTESDDLVAQAEALGLPIIQACSIVDLGTTPAAFSNE